MRRQGHKTGGLASDAERWRQAADGSSGAAVTLSELAILEAAYDLEIDRFAALEVIATAAATAFGARHPLFAWEIPTTCDFSDLGSIRVAGHGAPRVVEIATALAPLLPPGSARAALRAEPCFWSVSERFAGTRFLATARSMGMREAGVVHAAGCAGVGLNIVACTPAIATWSAARRHHWAAIAVHLGAAWRLRSSLSPPTIGAELELRPDGQPRSMPSGISVSAREVLRHAVRQREAARSRQANAAGRRLWPALIAGRWTLADAYTAGGTRYVVAHENPAGSAHLRALAPLERIALDLALAGQASKAIAIDLGMSPATVTRLLQRALRRLGAASLATLAGVQAARFDLLAHVADGLATAAVDDAAPVLGVLTPAEIDVVKGALEGRSTAAIASFRGTSARTVAHQLDASYHKLGVSSRRELLARLQ